MIDYDPDLADAATAVRSASSIANRDARRDVIATQSALALIDIAASLRVLAAAELGTLAAVELFDTDEAVADESVVEPVDLTDADPGTRVRLITDPERQGELTGSGGVDQGIPWVGVRWATEDGFEPGESRVFVPHLEAVHAPTLRNDWAYPDATSLAEPGAPVDGLDADFDGDPVPTKTTDAIDALKAAKKKGKGKR